jgi:hypothetical protein
MFGCESAFSSAGLLGILGVICLDVITSLAVSSFIGPKPDIHEALSH